MRHSDQPEASYPYPNIAIKPSLRKTQRVRIAKKEVR